MIRKYQNKLLLKGVECFKLHTPKVCLYLKLQIRSQHLPLLMFNKYVYKDHIEAWTYQAFFANNRHDLTTIHRSSKHIYIDMAMPE